MTLQSSQIAALPPLDSPKEIKEYMIRMRIQYSPWGHPVRRVSPRKSLTRELRTSYRLVPFHCAYWNFLGRGAPIESTGPTILAPRTDKHRVVTVAEKIYKTDPFSFNPTTNPYLKFLNDYAADLDSTETWTRREFGPLDKPEDLFCNVMSLTPVDRPLVQQLVAEVSIARKFNIQRLVSDYWYGGSFTPRPIEDPTGEVKDFFQLLAREGVFQRSHFLRKTLEDPVELADPLATNPGAPTFISGPEFRLLNAKFFEGVAHTAERDWNSSEAASFTVLEGTSMVLPRAYVERLAEVAEHFDVPAPAVIGCGSNKRTGPGRKWTPLYYYTGNDVVADVEIQNLTAIRRVYMVANHFNLMTGPPVQAMVGIRKAIPGGYYDRNFITHASQWWRGHGGGSVFFESDFSAMDANFPVSFRTAILQEIQRRLSNAVRPWQCKLLEGHSYMPYLIPDFLDTSNNSRAGVLCIPKAGGIGLLSGLKATSSLDSIGALVYLHAVLKRLWSGEWNNHIKLGSKSDLFTGNQGDDIIIGLSGGLASRIRLPSQWRSIYRTFVLWARRFGWDSKMIPGDTYLMKHMYFTDEPTPVLARVIQQTFSNEKIRGDEEIALLGLAARTMGSGNMINNRFAEAAGVNPVFRKRYADYVEFYIETMRKHPLALDNWDLVTAVQDVGRRKTIVRLGATVQAMFEQLAEAGDTTSESAKMDPKAEALMNLLVGDRFSTSTKELLTILQVVPRVKDAVDAVALKEKKLYESCMHTMYSEATANVSKTFKTFQQYIGR